MLKKNYKHAHFQPDAFGHGGNKRTAQINGLINDSNISFTDVDFSTYSSSFKNPLYYLKGIKYTHDFNLGIKKNYTIGKYLEQFEKFISEKKPNLFIWESTVAHYLLIAVILKKYNITIIALPHNIESLVAGAQSFFSGKISPHWLNEELTYLSMCQKIFTISQEEEWLLSASGLAAEYLPYYPADQARKFLLKIRTKKEQSVNEKEKKIQVLLLGTFYNKPTFDGYIELINNIKQQKNILINVAGYGSEYLKNLYNDSNVQIWGSVSNQDLEKLIIICDCAIIHQQPSSGALTRIPELLMAGLPLLANGHAARSNRHLNGITVYHSFLELIALLQSFKFTTPLIPAPPAQETLFKDYLKGVSAMEIKTNS